MTENLGKRVTFHGIAKSYGGHQALHPTDLTIEPGEIFAIIGPSGSGKSTLLGLTAGYVTPTAGQIKVDGNSIEGAPPFQRNIGMVFQGYSLFPHMTVGENIGFPLKVRRTAKVEIQRRVTAMLDLVRLNGLSDRYPAALSGGQQQRVALARAAIYNPALLLMDEPLSALDKNLRDQMQYEIKQFHKSVGSTFLYVTHDQSEAASLADRIAIMADGQVQQIGSARELYEHPTSRFVATFLGNANIFDVVGKSEQAGVTTLRTSFGATIKSASSAQSAVPEQFCVCVRPESMTVSSAALDTDNAIAGTINDVTFMTGSVRYKIDIERGPQIQQIQKIDRLTSLQTIGDRVNVGWNADATMLVRV